MAGNVQVTSHGGLFGIVILAVTGMQFATIDAVFGQSQSSEIESNKSEISSQDASRSSSLFNSPTGPKLFRLPELPSPRFSSLPGFSLLKETASNSYAMTKRTSRRMWNRTKEILRPFDPVESEAENMGYEAEDTSRGSSWLWWKSSQAEEQKIETVNDFLRQDRPKL